MCYYNIMYNVAICPPPSSPGAIALFLIALLTVTLACILNTHSHPTLSDTTDETYYRQRVHVVFILLNFEHIV